MDRAERETLRRLRLALRALARATRVYLDARDRVDPAAEAAARRRLDAELRRYDGEEGDRAP